jgi:hypothetical protein
MIHCDIPEPVLSQNFTLDDIHKVRRWNYERLKDATVEEQIEDIRRQAAPGIAYLEELRKQKLTEASPCARPIRG